MGKTNFNMQLTDIQKEIMDFVTEVIFQDVYSKANLVSIFFKNRAMDYVDIPEDMNISDEELMSLLRQRKRDKDMSLLRMIGAEQYRKLLDDFKVNYPNGDASYMEGLLKDFESNKGGQE